MGGSFAPRERPQGKKTPGLPITERPDDRVGSVNRFCRCAGEGHDPSVPAETAMVDGHAFIVDTEPAILWHQSPTRLDEEFLSWVDVEYFAFIADTFQPLLDTDHALRAAMAMRTGYAHGLETFFALLCAAIQAPDCVSGWMLRHRPTDIRRILAKIRNGTFRDSVLAGEPTTFLGLAQIVHERLDVSADLLRELANAWARLSQDYLSEHFTTEYNSIKHGLRARSGGHRLAIGKEPRPGESASPMSVMGFSQFGSTFLVSKRLARGSKQNVHQFTASRADRNYDPRCVAEGLRLLSFSIGNVVSYLRVVKGVPTADCPFRLPEDSAMLRAPWKNPFATTSFFENPVLEPRDVPKRSKQEVVAACRKALKGLSDRGSEPQDRSGEEGPREPNAPVEDAGC